MKKTYETAESHPTEMMSGDMTQLQMSGRTMMLLSEDLKRQREINTELHRHVNDLHREIGVLRYLEAHIHQYIQGEAELDDERLQSLFESLQRIRGFYA